jgi:macrodomain Ter protein organizer (MatP/YcbG family)
MGKKLDNPRRNIISCRLDDREFQALQKIARQSGINLSELLRQTIHQAESKRPFAKAVNG